MKETVVCVEWEDATFNAGYFDKEKELKFRPTRTKTIGFVIRSDRKAVIISHDRFYDEQGKVDDERHITTIPRGMIRRITRLEL